MPTLLLRLCGPMQSWGTQSQFTERETEREPSKSGVIGLLCAALGRPRTASVDDLAALRMGVRVDSEGRPAVDYHTAGGKGGIIRASGGMSPNAVLSNRYFLQDADFLVGLEGPDRDMLNQLEGAVREPVWQTFLGRKSFVPSVPLDLSAAGGGLRELPLEEALRAEPWPLKPSVRPRGQAVDEAKPLRFVFETENGRESRMDQPLGAAFATRSFGMRRVTTTFERIEVTI